jgi:hypothetical protein
MFEILIKMIGLPAITAIPLIYCFRSKQRGMNPFSHFVVCGEKGVQRHDGAARHWASVTPVIGYLIILSSLRISKVG